MAIVERVVISDCFMLIMYLLFYMITTEIGLHRYITRMPGSN